MPPEVRLRCRVLLMCALAWELAAIYDPLQIQCDMFEVVTISDLMVFVCPCGTRCLTENGYDTHLESTHSITHCQLTRLDKGGSTEVAKSQYSQLLGLPKTQEQRLTKLIELKRKIPRVADSLMSNIISDFEYQSKTLLPKWQEMDK